MEARYDLNSAEPLLEHMEWVRRLAERIVGDPAEADDLSQEVWLVARRLEGSEQAIEASAERRWLGKIVRTLARNRSREARTRSLHEVSAGSEAVQERKNRLRVSRVTAQSRMVELLLSLDEPYRSTLLQRYFDDMTPTEIAEETGASLSAVKSRLHRGLAKLRESAWADGLGPSNTLAVLAWFQWSDLPWVQAAVSPNAALLRDGGGSVRTAVRPESWSTVLAAGGLASAAAVVSALGLGWLDLRKDVDVSGGAPAVELRNPGPESLAPGASTRQALVPLEELMAERFASDLASNVERPLGSGELAPGAGTVHVTVVDLSGERCGDAQVRLLLRVDGRDLAVSEWSETDASGEVALTLVPFPCVIDAQAPGKRLFATHIVQQKDGYSSTQVILADRVDVRGRVVDAQGRGVEGARVLSALFGDYRSRTPVRLDNVTMDFWETQTASDGTFELKTVGDGLDPYVGAHCPGYEPSLRRAEIRADGGAITGFEIVLEEARPGRLHGVLRHADGSPATDGFVSDGVRTVRTDGQGRFEFFSEREGRDMLYAGAPGSRPVRVPLALESCPVGIQLEEESPALTGQVVDASGRPVAGVHVTVHDQTWVGPYRAQTDGRLANIPMSLEMFSVRRKVGVADLAKPDSPQPYRVVTDEEGRFELSGLEERTYDLLVRDPDTLASSLVGSYAAGSQGVMLVFHPELVDVSFRVVDGDGEPLSGVEVTPKGIAIRPDKNRDPYRHFDRPSGDPVVTDAQGRGEFLSLSAGSRLVPTVAFPWFHGGIEIEGAGGEGSEIELRAEPSAHAILVSRSSEDAPQRERRPTSFRFLDRSGKPVPILHEPSGLGIMSVGRFPSPQRGTTMSGDAYRVPIRATTLQVMDSDGLISEENVQLEKGSTLRRTF